jgi:hypothetical protein
LLVLPPLLELPPHVPLLQSRKQQSVFVLHFEPSFLHSKHLPPEHSSLQHWADVEHDLPSPVHAVGSPHVPPEQVPLQQFADDVHDLPFAVHLVDV